MNERWWPGLREHVRAVEENKRLDERDRKLGFPVFLTGANNAPGPVYVRFIIGIAVLAILTVGALGVDGDRAIPIVGLAVAASLFLVEGWYGLGARKLRSEDRTHRNP